MAVKIFRAAVVLAAVVALVVPAASSAAAATKPVPSLQPAATAKLWRQLVRRARPVARGRAADCVPLRLVFYAATDWLRLATKLAANQAPCAQYYVSIPPLAADKTTFRPDQPWRIRALGANFHALAEINYTGWSSWVAANGSSWYAAGVEARRRMSAQGFDVAAGDAWAVNEFSTAVRAGTGAARANVRELVRGLYNAGGNGPPVQGAVFIVGVAQSPASLSVYKGFLESWYADTPFWTDMTSYVSDWSQELYGDVRNYAVPGAPLDARRDELAAYLEHELTLANAGPPEIGAARAFLQTAYSPLANAAWQWESAYGWTAVPFDQMQDYVSAQTYALRANGAHFGFAWALKMPSGMSSTEFANETGAIADRLAAAIHDSAAAPESACAGTCTLSLPGAAFNEAWKGFATWSAPALGFATAPMTLAAGTPSGPLSVQLQLVGVAHADTQPVTVTLASSSPQGAFSASPSGPWTPTLGVTIPAGSTAATFYYLDLKAGAPTITASAPGRTSATQTETVTGGAVATLTVTPASANVPVGKAVVFTASAADAYGNAVAVAPTWSSTLGRVSPVTGSSTTFVPVSPGTGSVVATVTTAAGTVTASAQVTVVPGKLRVSAIAYARQGRRLRVTFTVRSGSGGPVVRASVAFALRRNGRSFRTGVAKTDVHGRAIFTTVTATRACYAAKIVRVAAHGFVWNGVTPKNGACR